MTGKLPKGSWDTHCHVFGPASEFPWAPNRTYTPAEQPKQAMFDMHASIGADHAVIVHPACHGYDMGVTLDAVAASGGRYRAIALIPEDIADSELERYHRGGVRGVRFNFARSLGEPPEIGSFFRISDRIADLGWHIVLHFDPASLIDFPAISKNLTVPFVLDHFGRIRAENGVAHASFKALTELAGDPNCWIKVSAADRASSEPAPYRDVIPFARRLIEQIPDRILWGTDWPHPNVKGPMPNEPDLVALLLEEFAPDETLQRKILIENPAVLYGG